MELDLHQLGYRYVGSASLYQLTWFEIYRIIDASLLRQDTQSGVRKGDLNRFRKFNEKLRAKKTNV